MSFHRTHSEHSAIDDEPVAATRLEAARAVVAERFPAAAERILAGEWDRGPVIENALNALPE